MDFKSQYAFKVKRLIKRIWQYIIFFLILFVVLMGTWCVPPKWTEKVVQELKAKYIVEKLEKKDV